MNLLYIGFAWGSVGIITGILWTWYRRDRFGWRDLFICELLGPVVPLILLIAAVWNNTTLVDFWRKK